MLLTICTILISLSMAGFHAIPQSPNSSSNRSQSAGARQTKKRSTRARRAPATQRGLAPSASFSQRGVSQSSFAGIREKIAEQQKQGTELWNYHEAYLYWLQQKAYPKNKIDWNSFGRAFSLRSRMSDVRFSRNDFAPVPPPRWEFIGPRNLPVPYQQYYGEGMVSGRVNAVAFDPNNSNILYVASAGGGFWKSVNGGQTWTCLSDRWENVRFSSVAVHPSNSNIIIVGTGDYPGGMGYGYGLMMTTDGSTWTNVLRNELRWFSVSQILFDPDDPNIITVTAGRHPQNKGIVFRSGDGGKSWSRVLAAAGSNIDWSNIQISAKGANNRRHYYAVGVLSGNGFQGRSIRNDPASCTAGEIWRSANRGVTWAKLAGPSAGNCIEALGVATSPSSSGVVYVASKDYQEGPGHIWMSPDSGGSWNEITNDFPHHYDPEEGDSYNWSQAYYDFYIKTSKHPTSGRDIIYVGLIDIVASIDGGATWQTVGRTYSHEAKTHNDQHALAVNPRNPNDLLIGNDGGVYRVTFDPAATSWSFQNDMNAGLGMTMFYRIAIHPTQSDWIMGGTQDNATPVSMGDLHKWANKGGGDGGFCAINSRDPKIQFATSQKLSIFRTEDGWTSHEPITEFELVTNEQGQTVRRSWGNDRRGFIAPIALSPNDPNTLYAGTNYLWKWDDRTRQWSKRLGNQVLASTNGYVNFIAIAPSDNNRIYTGSSIGDLWMTTNGGNTWQRIDNDNLPGASPALPVTSIAVHPTNPDKILVGFGSTEAYPHLWRCDNTRAAEIRWTPLGGTGNTALPSIPINAVVMDSLNPDRVYYVGSDIGVFLSNDAGATWANFGTPNGLPNVQITDLQFVPGKRQLVAATFGRGAWRINLAQGAEPVYPKPGAGLRSGPMRDVARAVTSHAESTTSPESQAIFDQVKGHLLAVANRESRQQVNRYVWPPAINLDASTEFGAYATRFRKGSDGSPEAPIQNQKFLPYITITQGAMTDLIENDADRLAFVMGHEIAHVMLGHVLPTSLVEKVPQKTLKMIFSAEQEHEADLLGMKLALAADYSITGARNVWYRINSEEFLRKYPGFKYTSFEGISSTHPAWTDRLELIDQEKQSLWKAMSSFENGVYLLTFQRYAEAQAAFNRVLDPSGCHKLIKGKRDCRGFPESYDAQANLGYALLMQYLDKLDENDIARLNIGQVVTGSFYTRPEALPKGIDEPLWHSAVAALNKAIELNPRAQIAKATLGLAYLLGPPSERNLPRALRHLDEAANALQDDTTVAESVRAAVLINSAVALLASDDLDRATARLDKAERLLTSDEMFEAMRYNRALILARSQDVTKRANAIPLLTNYLKQESPASLWWHSAFTLYTRLVTEGGEPPVPEDSFKQIWRDELQLRPVVSVEIGTGVQITLADSVTDVYDKLGAVSLVPAVTGTPLNRLHYPERGLEFLATRKVVAIFLRGRRAPQLKIQRERPGAPVSLLRIGMTATEVSKLLRTDFLPVQLMDLKLSYDFYPSAGVAVRYDKNDKVEEIAITRPAIR